MAIGADYINRVRQYIRISATTFDGEISDLINAARADLALGGVTSERVNDETDPLILRAVGTYVKAEFGIDNPDAEGYRAAYKALKIQLLHSDKYIIPAEGG